MTVPYNADAIAKPWTPALSPHSAWIFCSAPEMTTVSNPNRNPANAEVIDHRTMRRLNPEGLRPVAPSDRFEVPVLS